MIRLQIDRKAYADQALFDNFELSLRPGELLCLLGPSGCGKTTLLNLVAGLDRNFQGRLDQAAVDPPGQDQIRPDSMRPELGPLKPRASELSASPADARRPGPVSYMFQQPRLLPWRTVRQNLALVIEPEQQSRIEPLLATMGLTDCADAYPNSLSLGMARRVALARSLIVEPELILMDEPFVSLDPPTADEMRQLVRQIRSQRPQTSILFVTHDLREAIALADRILLLGGQPTQVRYQWQGQVPQSQRDARYLAEQEARLLSRYRLSDGGVVDRVVENYSEDSREDSSTCPLRQRTAAADPAAANG